MLEKIAGISGLIPTPWKILAAAIFVAVYTAFIFNKGAAYADGKHAKEQAERLAQMVIDHNEQAKKDLEAAIKSLDKQEDIRKMFDGLKGDLERSIREKPVFVNKDCALDEADLSIWNGKGKKK